ncbi:unnamed protein product [Arabidopsis halleri]
MPTKILAQSLSLVSSRRTIKDIILVHRRSDLFDLAHHLRIGRTDSNSIQSWFSSVHGR